MPMSKERNAAGPGMPPLDIVMFIVKNRYRGKYRSAPKNPCLLIVQAFNVENTMLIVRVMGINKPDQSGLDKVCVPWLEINDHLDANLRDYFAIDWDQQKENFRPFSNGKPVLPLIQ